MKESLFDLHEQIENKHWWFTARRQIIQKIIFRTVSSEDGITLINIGCGTGADLSFLSNFYQCVGIDSSPKAVAAARKRAPKASVILGSNLDAVPERKNGQRRAWLFLDVLEHIKEDRKFFSSFSKLIEPGEKTIITVPANPNLWSSHDDSFGHFRRYTIETIKMIWDELPFNILLLSHFNSRLYPLIWPVRKVKNILGIKVEKSGSDFFLLPSLINKILYKIFYGEHRRILRIMDGASPYYYGTSLIAVLKRL